MALMKKEVVYQIETYAQDGKKVEYFRPIYPQNETDIADGFYVALFNMNTPNGMLNCRVEYKAESLDDAFDQFERVANDGANDIISQMNTPKIAIPNPVRNKNFKLHN